MQLDARLPCRHTAQFQNDQERTAANWSKCGSKLFKWFRANEKYPVAKHTLYLDLAKYFTLNKFKKLWVPRPCFTVNTTQNVETEVLETGEIKVVEDE